MSKRATPALPTKRCGGAGARRGTLYIAVLGVSMIVGMIALASASIARLELRRASAAGETVEAQLLAQAGLEYGLNRLSRQPDLLTTLTSGAEQPQQALGGGTIAWSIRTEAGGSMANENAVTVRGVGRIGRTRSVVEAQVVRTGVGALRAALHVDGILRLFGDSITTNQEVSSNTRITLFGSGARVTGNAWSTGTISSSSLVTGAVLDRQDPPREMPSGSVFDYYLANGTPISLSDLPNIDPAEYFGLDEFTARELSDTVLSPTSNPYGSSETNPEGIYIISCGGADLVINRMRVEGTLVVIGPGPNTQIDSEVSFSPAPGFANYPVLLVDGAMQFRMTDSNPADTFEGLIQGLVYVRGEARIEENCRFDGAFITDEIDVNESAQFDFRDVYLFDPPPGFFSLGDVEVVPGSFVRTAY